MLSNSFFERLSDRILNCCSKMPARTSPDQPCRPLELFRGLSESSWSHSEGSRSALEVFPKAPGTLLGRSEVPFWIACLGITCAGSNKPKAPVAVQVGIRLRWGRDGIACQRGWHRTRAFAPFVSYAHVCVCSPTIPPATPARRANFSASPKRVRARTSLYKLVRARTSLYEYHLTVPR